MKPNGTGIQRWLSSRVVSTTMYWISTCVNCNDHIVDRAFNITDALSLILTRARRSSCIWINRRSHVRISGRLFLTLPLALAFTRA